MPTLTKRWSFASDAEGWQLETGGATGITSGWTAADNATGDSAGSGSLWVRRSGQNLLDGYIRWRRTLSATDIGVPPQAIITRMRVTYWARCAVYDTGSPSSLTADPYVYVPGRGMIYSPGSYRGYGGTTSWAQHLDTWAPVDLLPSEQMTIYCEAMPRTGNSSTAQVELRSDAIEISVEYVLPEGEPSGALSVTVGMSEIAQFIEAGSLRITRGANGRAGQCSFRCLATGWTDPLGSVLEAGTDISVETGGRRIFRGEITRVDVSSQGGHVRYDVNARDAIGKLARRVLPYLSVSSTTVGSIVSTIVTSYCSGLLDTDTSYIVDSRAVASWTVQADSVVDALEQIAAQYPAAWYVDDDLRLHWRPIGALEHSGRRYAVAPGPYDDGQLIDSISYETDMATLANRVTVISSYDSQTPGSASPNPSASGDDGYLSGSSTTTWPVPAASAADTSSAVLRVRGGNITPKTTTTISATTRVRSGKTGNSWPPTASFTPTDNYIESTQWTFPPFYELQCQGFRFDIPSGLTGISQIELIITVANVADFAGDQQNTIWVESTDQANYGVAVAEPQFFWYGMQLANGPVTLSVMLENAGDSVFYRMGIRSGTPGGLNQAEIVNVQMRITHDDPANASYQESRALVRFDTSSIPDTATLTSAVLRLYCPARSGSWTPQIEVRTVSPSIWPIDTADWSYTGGSVLATVSAASISAEQWLEIAIPTTAISVTGQTALVIRVSPDSAPGSYQDCQIDFSSYDAGTNRPQLVVQYTVSTPGVSYTAQDLPSQAAYGVRELAIYRPGATLEECTELALLELSKRAWPAEQIDFSSFSGWGIWPGQKAYLDLSPVLAPGHMIVTGVRMTLLPNERVRYTISAIGTLLKLEDLLLEALR